MKINVKFDSNLGKSSASEPAITLDLPDDKNTLEDVLIRLSRMYADLVLVENGKVHDDLRQLFLNGVSYTSFPEGLKKTVNEGDAVLVDVYIGGLAGG